ncbi:hypothetical protein A3L11_04630 [Thermococcus siculi]|uniref:Uncharacterized protein n=1 Tax=Thermococcus siculi TaxID=72803 RepID=A0A2Z2MLN6_9EURY|nr:hypothetical protein [Thermococcus siculi]ASJ08555.1 hypothetical protein A3L11_04630 [Thermococcus siculi]
MGDILVPKERRDAVVLIGVDGSENVEFIKVYAVSEEVAKQTLEEFFSAKGLFPSDYRLVSRGSEEVGERSAITTRSESSLGAALARLGLKLLSNGVLYLDGVERLYQFTLVSETLYERITAEKKAPESYDGESLTAEEILSLGVDVLVENLSGMDLSKLLPEKALLLREPTIERVAELLAEERDYPVVVETRDAGKYEFLDFPIILRLPPLSPEEFAQKLSERLGFEVSPGHFLDYPAEKLNMRNVEALARLVGALIEKRGLSAGEALSIAVRLNLGEL